MERAMRGGSVDGNAVRLYWFLDVREDDCRARTNHAAENLNVLRKTALYLLRKTSVPENVLGSASNDFLHDALFGQSEMTLPWAQGRATAL
jgi:hypothetical protein